MARGSIRKQPNGRYLARIRGDDGKEASITKDRKADAQRWLDEQNAALLTGTFVNPKAAKMTVGAWADTWLAGYASRRPRTVKAAESHIVQIKREFGGRTLASLRPSHVRTWMVKLKAQGLSDSYVHMLHRRLSQVLADAVHDGLLTKNPCSRRTAPRTGAQKAYVATTAQVWALYDAMPGHLRPAILLGALAGLRTGEVVGLRVTDVDFEAGVVHPVQQEGGEPLKTAESRTPLPIPRELVVELAAAVDYYGGDYVVTDGTGRQTSTAAIERAIRLARVKIDGLPENFRFHDLRHYFASLLIASGLDVKLVQHRLRHSSAATTLDVYSHLWPDTDESARSAVGAVLTARVDPLRTDPVELAEHPRSAAVMPTV